MSYDWSDSGDAGGDAGQDSGSTSGDDAWTGGDPGTTDGGEAGETEGGGGSAGGESLGDWSGEPASDYPTAPEPWGTPGESPGEAGEDYGLSGGGDEVGSGARWHFFCPGHFASYREGRDHEDHPNEYGAQRNLKYLAEDDMRSHIDQWPSHVEIATVEQE